MPFSNSCMIRAHPTFIWYPGNPPALRINGDIERIKYKTLDSDPFRGMLYEIAPEQKIKVFEETGDVDFGYEIPGLARYRANFFMQKKRRCRRISANSQARFMTAEQLGLPPVIPKLAALATGAGAGHGPHRQRQVDDPGRYH